MVRGGRGLLPEGRMRHDQRAPLDVVDRDLGDRAMQQLFGRRCHGQWNGVSCGIGWNGVMRL